MNESDPETPHSAGARAPQAPAKRAALRRLTGGHRHDVPGASSARRSPPRTQARVPPYMPCSLSPPTLTLAALSRNPVALTEVV